MARNAGIHPESIKEYIASVKSPRFCDGAEFHVDREHFNKMVEDTEGFFGWVVESLIPTRKATQSKQQPAASAAQVEVSGPPQNPTGSH